MEKKLESQRRPVLNLRIELKELVKVGEVANLMEVLSTKDGRMLLRRQDLASGSTDATVWTKAGRGAAEQQEKAPLWIQWLAGMSAKDLFAQLRLDRGTHSLARDKRRVLWVAGAKPHQRSRPQVHLDRETRILRRIVESRKESFVDVFFEGQFKTQSSVVWPRFMTIFDGHVRRTYEVTRLVEEATFGEGEFTLEDAVRPEVPQ